MTLFKLISFFVVSCFILNAQELKIAGDKNYPPYSYEEDGIAKGIYVDILKAAFKKIPQYDLNIKMMAYKRAIAMTKKGSVVGFFPPYYGKERTSWTKFSTPILAETTVVFSTKKFLKDKKIFPKDYYGSTVCFNRGFNLSLLGGEEFAKAVKEKQIKLIEANDNKACLNRVQRKVADFYINDQFIDISQFSRIVRGPKVKENFGHIGFTLKRSKYPFIDHLETQFNNTIEAMKKSKEIENIVEKYSIITK